MVTRTLIVRGSMPVGVVPWTEAVTNLLSGRYYPIVAYDEVIRSAGGADSSEFPGLSRNNVVEIPLPAVMGYRTKAKHKMAIPIRYSKPHVWARDDYTCQYCNQRMLRSSGTVVRKLITIDHVHPQSKGGHSGWGNCVTACAPCNTRKGDKLLNQTNMALARRPGYPDRAAYTRILLRDPNVPDEWMPFLKAS